LLKNNPRLPGLINRTDIANEYPVALPGFPKIESEQPSSIESTEEKETTQKKNTRNQSFSKDVSNDQVYYDEQSSTTIYPTNEIQRLVVSVVIDKQQFELMEIQLEDLEALISKTAGIKAARGDELLIRFLPFATSSFGLKKLFMQNKDQIEAIKATMFKLRWFIIGLAGFIIVGTIGGILFITVRSYMRKKTQIQVVKKKQEEEIQIKETQRKADEMAEKKNSILGLAKNKPDDFSALIVNWIFSEETEEVTDGGK